MTNHQGATIMNVTCKACSHERIAHGWSTGCLLCHCKVTWTKVPTAKATLKGLAERTGR